MGTMRRAPRVWDREIDRRTLVRAGGGLTLGAGALAGLPAVPAMARQATPQASPVAVRAGGDWPTLQGSPARTGRAVDSGPVGHPELLWRFESGLGGALASAVIVDGLVLFTPGVLGGAALVALDLATGEQAWSVELAFQPLGTTPAVADGVAYLAGLQGDVGAVDLASRKVLWQTKLDAGTSSSPLVADDVLYVAAKDDHLYALDVADGRERWRFSVGEGTDYTLGPSPAFADGLVLLGNASETSDRGLYAIDAASGEERWRFEPDEPGLYTPALVDGLVYVAGDGGDVYALDAASGQERWKSTVGETWSTPAVAEDAVLVQTMDGLLVCLDRQSGEARWQADSGASWCSPVVAGDVAYVGNGGMWFEQGVHAFDVATGEERWYMRVASVTGAVAISGNVLVVADDEGAVCAIGGSDSDAVERGTDGNGAFLTRIAFSTEVDEWNVPIDPADAFPEGTSVLLASFDHVGIKYEAAWEVIWTLDGEPLATRSDAWQGGTGRVLERISANEGSLAPGRYGLELRLDGIPVRRGEAVIG